MRAPISARSRGSTPFTVARVPTGMNTGVSTGPCGVSITPRLASPSRCVTRNPKPAATDEGYTRIDNSTSGTDDVPFMKRLRVGVIYGGRSGEHEVSLASAAAVFAHLDRQRYEPVPIRIEKDGRWALAERAPSAMSAAEVIEHARLEAGRAPRIAREVHLMARPSDEPLLSINRAADRNGPLDRGDRDGAVVQSMGLDVVFPVLHGPYGEDGTVQGLLELANVPYVGAGVLASAVGMDKAFMKLAFAARGLPISGYRVAHSHDWQANREAELDRVATLGYP